MVRCRDDQHARVGRTRQTAELDLLRLYLDEVGRDALEQALGDLPERERQVERSALAALRRPAIRARLGDLVAA